MKSPNPVCYQIKDPLPNFKSDAEEHINFNLETFISNSLGIFCKLCIIAVQKKVF